MSPKDNRWYYIVNTPIRHKDGSISKMAMIQDITRQKETIEEIKNLNKYLEEHAKELEIANKEMEAFNYSVSHDLRLPLVGIEGLCRILIKKYADRLDTKGKEYIERISRTTCHMQRIIRDLLNLSRAMRNEMRDEVVDLSGIARNVAEMLSKQNPERIVECDIIDGLIVHGDEGLLLIAMENLMANAWKFTGRKKHTTVKFGVTIGNQVCLTEDVRIFTHSHSEASHIIREYHPVKIGDYVKIYSGATIMPGVTIGEQAIVASHSLVTQDVPPNAVVAGTPARAVRERRTDGRKGDELDHIWLF